MAKKPVKVSKGRDPKNMGSAGPKQTGPRIGRSTGKSSY